VLLEALATEVARGKRAKKAPRTDVKRATGASGRKARR
jgi:hypothetical protein